MRHAAALVLAALVVGAPWVEAQSDWTRFDDTGLRMRVESPWPAQLSSGYLPMFVYLENDSAQQRTVSFVATANNWRTAEHKVRRTLVLGPGESIRREVSAPAFGLEGDTYYFDVSYPGGRSWVTPARQLERDDVGVHAVLVFTDGEETQAIVDGWREALAIEKEHWSGTPQYDVSLATIVAADAPRRVDTYTSLHAVLVDTVGTVATELPEAAVAFARLGGTLVFVGPDAERFARAVPGVAPWLEPRFARDLPGRVYSLGHGLVVLGEEDGFLGQTDVATIRTALEGATRYVPSESRRPRFVRPLPIPGVKEMPFRLFILALVSFFVLIGPINFVLVKRTARPSWLLVTIPLLALVASVGVLAYGILYQGIDLKEAEETFTVLDQRTHVADTVELRAFFAGISPTDGLRPDIGTACFPVAFTRRVSDPLYLLDQKQGPVLSGEFLPVRREGAQVIVSERSARGRLTFTREDEQHIRCENGFETALERLALKGEDGWTYVWERGDAEPLLAAGGSVVLARAEISPDLIEWMPQPIDGRDLSWGYALPRSTYLAVVESNPFADDTGLVPDVVTGEHVVLGVLEQEEARW